MKSRKLVACLLNVLALPGLGTFFLHRTRQALLQVVLSFAGLGLTLGGSLGLLNIAQKTSAQLSENPALEKRLLDLGEEGKRISPSELSPEDQETLTQNLKGFKLPLFAFLCGLLIMFGTWIWGIVVLFLPSQEPQSPLFHPNPHETKPKL